MNLAMILLIIALILFFVQALGVSTRVHLGWLGMAVLTLGAVLGGSAVVL